MLAGNEPTNAQWGVQYSTETTPENSRPGTPCVDEITSLAQKWAQTEYYFQQSRAKFHARYDESAEGGEGAPGRGETFPDDDRTVQIDIQSLLRAQPHMVEAELKFHKELFSKLKWNHLELDTKDTFVKKILRLPPDVADEETAAMMEERTLEAKKLLKETKTRAQASQKHVETLIETTHEGYNKMAQRFHAATENSRRYAQLEAQLNEQRVIPLVESEALLAERARHEEQHQKLKELESEIEKYKTMLSEKRNVISTLENDIHELNAKKEEAEANAEETCKQASKTDPKAEELGRWYKTQSALLKQIQGIKEIRHPSTTQMEIVYQLDKHNECRLDLLLSPPTNAANGWNMSATCDDSRCPLESILTTAHTYFTKLDDQVAYVVREVPNYLRTAIQRDREMDELSQQHEGILYDPERGELTLQNEASGKALIVQLSGEYPVSGIFGMEIVAVEGDERTVGEWNERVRQPDVNNLGDVIQMLQ
ncbi:hypothetical protein HDV00_005703 [Rhizophlyctis rosea]|nr:hypothetical protein HDV00_005703 [Rhizophlyctis rosea]